MLKHYLTNLKGDGFLSLKTMEGSQVKRYDAFQLSTNKDALLVIKEEDFDKEVIQCQIGPYLFLEEGMKWIESSIIKMIENKVEPIYLDEIGLLELDDLGFSNILKKMVESNLELVISIRTDLVEQIIHKYNLKDVLIICE
jgi:nucleoside-triphosphatase THEP1